MQSQGAQAHNFTPKRAAEKRKRLAAPKMPERIDRGSPTGRKPA